jgi:hypothetical protein
MRFEVRPHRDTVLQLKLQIQREVHVPPDQQRLIFAGKELRDHELLETYRISDSATLHLIGRIPGGAKGIVLKNSIKKQSEQLTLVQKKLKKAVCQRMGIDDEDEAPNDPPGVIMPVLKKLREVLADHRRLHNDGENLVKSAIKRLSEEQLHHLKEIVVKSNHGVTQPDRLCQIALVVSPEMMLIDDCMEALKTIKVETMELFVEVMMAHYFNEKMALNSAQIEKDVSDQIAFFTAIRTLSASGSMPQPAASDSQGAGDRCMIQ